ncbi:hypothetical protein EVA_12746 [gut metagenome]|uniref:Uncharacterized protein n=1 Tax=gut metagenome TaxID=749906 RepID=J9GI35_9ZZZZ
MKDWILQKKIDEGRSFRDHGNGRKLRSCTVGNWASPEVSAGLETAELHGRELGISGGSAGLEKMVGNWSYPSKIGLFSPCKCKVNFFYPLTDGNQKKNMYICRGYEENYPRVLRFHT